MISVNEANPGDLAKLQQNLNSVVQAIGAESGGMKRNLTESLLQMQRFVVGNIEVDTSRTKNSVFPSITGSGNSILALLASNVRYSLYVRNAGHNEQFFDYASRVEGPNIARQYGKDIITKVEKQF